MFTTERHTKILDILKEKKSVSVNELADYLEFSPATIRTDLNFLDKQGLLMRTHGGATKIQEELTVPTLEEDFTDRERKNPAEKKNIAEKAFEYIEDNQCIIIDASSTCYELAKLINESPLRLIILTNGLNVINLLKGNPNLTTMIIGGVVRGNSNAIEGVLGADILDKINIDTAFVSPHAFSLDKGMMDFNLYEVELKKKMIEKAEKNIGLVDYTKLGKNSIASFANYDEIDILITDENADQNLVDSYISNGLSIVN